MKIKLLKDIPGYTAGEEINVENAILSISWTRIINEGFAEEIKNEVDIEQIRKIYTRSGIRGAIVNDWVIPTMSCKECEWFTAYRIVKSAIQLLDKDNLLIREYEIGMYTNNVLGKFSPRTIKGKSLYVSFLPKATLKTVEKIIAICEPELRVLFGIK